MNITSLTRRLSASMTMNALEGRQFMSASPYVTTPLESDTGFSTDAVGINATWQVLGGTHSPGTWRMCECGKIRYSPLGTQGLASDPDARAINAIGSVAGEAAFGTDPANDHAVVWRSQKKKGLVPTDLGLLPGGKNSHARDLNDAGQVVGWSDVGNGVDHAFIAKPGKKGKMTMSDLNALLPANGDYDLLDSANAINNSGQIIGLGRETTGAPYSSFFLQPTATGAKVTQIGGLPYKFGPTSRLKALNEGGQAVGFSKTNDAVHGYEEHAVLWQLVAGKQVLTDLNPTGDASHAHDVNNAGQVVGDFDITGTGQTHGFYYAKNKKGRYVFTDLNTMIAPDAGWVITSARGINELGQIAAVGVDARGHDRALLLTLRKPKAAAKPAALTAPATTDASAKATPFGLTPIKSMDEGVLGSTSALY